MEPKELTLSEIADIIWSGRKLIIRMAIIGALVALTISLFLPNWYKSETVILPPTSENAAFGAASLLGQFGLGNLLGSSGDVTRFIAILNSQRILLALNQKFDFQSRYETENLEETLKTLEDNLNVELGQENQIIVTFLDTDQDKVAEMTNYIAHCLDSLNILMFTTQARNNKQFIYSQVEIALDSLKILENQTRNFMKDEGVLSLSDQVTAGITAAAELQAAITTKEIELSVALKTLNPADSKIKRLQLEISSLKNKYEEFFSNSNNNKLIPNLEKIPDLEIKFLQLKRKAEYFKKVIEFLGPQYEQAKIEEAKEIPTVQVLDIATRPEKKSKPKRSIITLIGLLSCTVLTCYWVYFKNRPNFKSTT